MPTALDHFRHDYKLALQQAGIPLDMSQWTTEQAAQAELIRFSVGMQYTAIGNVTLAGALGA